MMEGRGSTWIRGTKDGRPVLFNLQTGETVERGLSSGSSSSSNKRKKVKRKRPDSKSFKGLLTHVARESSSSHWVSGQRDGKQIYFNTITKEERLAPPTVVAGKVSSAVPTVTVLEPLSSFEGNFNQEESDQDLMEMLAFQIDDKANSNMVIDEEVSPSPTIPVVQKSKAEILKEKNREAAARSRMKKARKIALLESEAVELRGANSKLRELLCAREAELASLRSEVEFYRKILTDRVDKKLCE
jgi:hypothetical protein